MAILRADAENVRRIPEITAFVVDVVPTFCRGSETAVTDHLAMCQEERDAARKEREAARAKNDVKPDGI